MTAVARLARLRVPLGFVFGAFAFWLAAPTMVTLAAGGAVACAGEGLRVWAAGHLNKAQEVTRSGPYRWMTHPLYVGSSIMGAGLAVAAGSLAVAGLVALYLALTLTAAISVEEAALRQRFGDEYDRYRRGNAFTPAEAAGARRRFSLQRALANREHRAVTGLLAALLALAVKATV